jgi:hypothetical protein
MPNCGISISTYQKYVNLQFSGCHDLLETSRVAVEHEHQGFVVEIAHLGVQLCNI